MSAYMRPLASLSRTANAAQRVSTRSFHSPFVVLGDSPITAHHAYPPPISRHYEKEHHHAYDPYAALSGQRTYVVSEPDASTSHYQVPSGAYPTSSPYINFAATEAPKVEEAQYSSTGGSLLAHQFTTRAAAQNRSRVGESSAVRFGAAPGEMGARGGGYGGVGLVDRKGTVAGKGSLGERNPPPDGKTAEIFSKAGIDNAWKLRK